jgi:hypothetical protein
MRPWVEFGLGCGDLCRKGTAASSGISSPLPGASTEHRRRWCPLADSWFQTSEIPRNIFLTRCRLPSPSASPDEWGYEYRTSPWRPLPCAGPVECARALAFALVRRVCALGRWRLSGGSGTGWLRKRHNRPSLCAAPGEQFRTPPPCYARTRAPGAGSVLGRSCPPARFNDVVP